MSTSTASRGRLWFSVVAPIVAWSAQSGLGVIVTSLACAANAVTVARGSEIAMAIVAFTVTVASGVLAYGSWRRTSVPRLLADQGYEQNDMLALVGLFSSVLFGLGIIWTGLSPLIVHDVCERTR